ncbi:unnamed protein product [Parnassius apollo]|uniref:(apollo) hypothetical protein n=1 Tax=Parnassius apollo TaxID=110799 RepID=A0A8S3X0A4_PARAO|nr:unnamed protein product [Parnassius apollo]
MGKTKMQKMNKIQYLEYLRGKACRMRESKTIKTTVQLDDNVDDNSRVAPASLLNLDGQQLVAITSFQNSYLIKMQQPCGDDTLSPTALSPIVNNGEPVLYTVEVSSNVSI